MFWASEEELEKWNKLHDQGERYLIGFDPLPDPTPVCNKKWAWIIVGGKRQMAWVDNVTMKAYEADGYEKTDIEIPDYEFERWCRFMDL